MPQVLLNFTPELNERINFWSNKEKEKPEAFLSKIIAEYIEDLEDYQEAARISSEIKAGRMEVYSWEEVKKRLGLEEEKYYMYPAIFQPDGNMWTVTFPDIDNAFTSADTLEEAIIDARTVLEDCMYFREIQNDEIPEPSAINTIQCPAGGIIQMVAVSMQDARQLYDEPVAVSA